MTLACAALLTPMLAQSETGKSTENAKETPGESENTSKEAEEKTTELQELIVKGENAWFEDGKAIFVPRKSAKNIASDMASLIEMMNTGMLRVKQGEITTATGQQVNIFINGVPADGLDKATFWPKNALRVEFMESSNDPRFQGKQNILNFIMKEYVTGGLTKFSGYQKIPGGGGYSASSKLVWGKMTYQAIFKGSYDRDHQSGSERDENYSDVWYDGIHYDKISRVEESDQYTRNDNLYGGFTARYRTQKWTINHGVGLQWTRNPGSGSHGLTHYNPDIINGNDVLSRYDGKNLSPSVWGNYNITGKWSGGLNWTFAHSHNNRASSYAEGNLDPILNSTSEDSYRYYVEGYGSVNFNKKIYLSLNVSNTFRTFDTRYSGSLLSTQDQRNNDTKITAGFWYRPVPKFIFAIYPQYVLSYRDINHTLKSNQSAFGVNTKLWYTINSRNTLSFHTEYGQTVPPASDRNELLLRQTELKWIEGNPSLGFNNNYYFSLGYDFFPTSWMTLDLSATYTIYDKQVSITYRPGGTDYDGVIGSYRNGARFENLFINGTIGFSPFGGKLHIENELNYNYYRLKKRKTGV